MTNAKPFTNLQLTTLVVLRFLIGWHLLYEGFSKLMNPQWSSAGFLRESQWIMEGIAKWITSDPGVLNAVDFINTWGLIAIGLGLILGLLGRVAAVSGMILLLVYYLNNAPIPGLEYSIPNEGNNLIVSKTLIEAVALLVLVIFPTSHLIGLDLLVRRMKKRNN